MTRRFSEEWDAATHAGQDEAAASGDAAGDAVQQDVTAMLRAAAEDDAGSVMPDDVEARLRAALSAEFSSAPWAGDAPSEAPPQQGGEPGADAGSGAARRPIPPPAATPLPTRPARAERELVDESDEPTRIPGHSRGAASRPAHGADRAAAASSPVEPARQGATVTQLEDHRRRRSTATKAALALGAAAAVALGAVGVTKAVRTDDAPVADSATHQSTDPTTLASRVRVTQSETRYTAAGLNAQAASLITSRATPVEPVQANAQALGPLATAEGINTCLDAVGEAAAQEPTKVYADFGTYDGARAVVVVTVAPDGRKNAWVVSRTCHRADDLLAGPQEIQI